MWLENETSLLELQLCPAYGEAPGFDVWLMTVATPNTPGRRRPGPCCCAPRPKCVVPPVRGTWEGKTCTHMWDVMQEGGGGAVEGRCSGGGGGEGVPAPYCFRQMGFRGERVGGGEEGSVCVCWARSAGRCRGVFFLSVAEQWTPLRPTAPTVPAASQTWAKIAGHAPLFTSLLSSSLLVVSADPFRSAFYPPSFHSPCLIMFYIFRVVVITHRAGGSVTICFFFS